MPPVREPGQVVRQRLLLNRSVQPHVLDVERPAVGGNGAAVLVNNKVRPGNNPKPRPENS